MTKAFSIAAALAAAAILVAGAGSTAPAAAADAAQQAPSAGNSQQAGGNGAVGLANPAAVFCIKSGGTHVIRKAADGSEYGVCVFPDGTEMDAWEYFRTHAN